jgi:hypothetical protein
MYQALTTWLSTFETPDGISFEPNDLTTGVYLHNQVCVALAPDLFIASAINVDPGTNWMVRRNNLKKVANGIRLYVEQILNAENTGVPDVEDLLSEIDLGTMAKDVACENEDTKEEMTRLVQLILSSCVHGNNQESYVQTIMGLDEDVQEQLMHSIHAMSDLFQSGSNGGASPPVSPLASPLSSPKASSSSSNRASRSSFDLDDPFGSPHGSPHDTHSKGGESGRHTSNGSTTSSSTTNMHLAEQLDDTKKQNADLLTERE